MAACDSGGSAGLGADGQNREDAEGGELAASAENLAACGIEAESTSLVALLAGREDRLTMAVDDLKKERAALTKEKKELTKKLKSAERKKNRLKYKAKELSTKDILDVIVMRANAKSAAAKAAAKTDGQAPGEKCVPERHNAA